ncbi:MAG: NUDIX domain-containing protein [Bacteroidia bacterium]|nr:NUDIX domain-containing protein [Bacteroidia bacterium]
MKFPFGLKRAATLCILRHGDQFLLLKRDKNPHKGMFTPVGGKIEAHESPKNAAIRECFEETGIKLEDMDFCGVLTETSPVKYNWICYAYVAEIPHMDPPDCDEGTLDWIGFDEVPQIPTPTTDWFIYKFIIDQQKFVLDATYNADLELLEMKDELSGELLFKRKGS